MTSYYNEIDPQAAAWLRELIKAGHIAPGEVDTRSIEDVTPNDLVGFQQCHFFAGIGGWSLALRLAGVPDDYPVWTGSCPCQPFSAAGQGKGTADERHLWPAFYWLIEQRNPPIVFGEQVASKAGRDWLSLVRSDMEALDYRFGAADLCAAGVGAPHIRQRLYWVAQSEYSRREGRFTQRPGASTTLSSGKTGILANLPRNGREQWRPEPNGRGTVGSGELGKSEEQQPHGNRNSRSGWRQSADDGKLGNPDSGGRTPRGTSAAADRYRGPALPDGFWGDAAWVQCRDGKARPVEPGAFPLAHGIPGRVGLLRGYGNAIVPQLAAEFIQAALDTVDIM